MQELEKTILKETEQLVNMHYEDDSVKTIILRNLRNIRKNMSSKDIDAHTKCGECSRRKWYQKGYEDGRKNNNGWIPVEERLPEEGQEVWISSKTDCVRRGMYTKRLGDRRLEGFICSDGFMWMNTANAWKPYVAPEPYRPERSNDAKE